VCLQHGSLVVAELVMRVLVVDDDPATLYLCATALEAQGHSVVSCSSGGPALSAALREDFDLAMCELNLPDIHGLEVVRAIKMNAPALSVIVMSTLDRAEWGPASTEAGADRFLSKPLRLETLRYEVALAARNRAGIDVVLAVPELLMRQQLSERFRQIGARVRIADDIGALLCQLGEQAPQLFVVDSAVRDAHIAVMVSARRGIACFVLANGDDDAAAAQRDGAAFIVRKPAPPDLIVQQARAVIHTTT
jgi:DNA-binding response OmpR family regulator